MIVRPCDTSDLIYLDKPKQRRGPAIVLSSIQAGDFPFAWIVAQ